MIHRKHTDQAKWDALIKDYLGGLSANECGDKYGISKPTVLRKMRDLGIKRTCKEAVNLRIKNILTNGGHCARWKGGRWVDNIGYVRIHLGGSKNGREHVMIAEKILGRKIKKGEVIHHINGDTIDNRPNNLLIATNSFHRWIHGQMSILFMQQNFRDQCHTESALFIRRIKLMSLSHSKTVWDYEKYNLRMVA